MKRSCMGFEPIPMPILVLTCGLGMVVMISLITKLKAPRALRSCVYLELDPGASRGAGRIEQVQQSLQMKHHL